MQYYSSNGYLRRETSPLLGIGSLEYRAFGPLLQPIHVTYHVTLP